MKKRNAIIAAAATAILGSGLAFAGAKSCEHNGGHHKGHFSQHKMERMLGVSKMDKHLSLSDAQENALQEILESNKAVFASAEQSHREFRSNLMNLDPTSENFDMEIEALAEKAANQAKQRTLEMAAIVKEVSAVLTEEQRQQAKEMMSKRMQRHQHEMNEGDNT